MKHPDIKVGESYAYGQGRRLYDAAQVIILDKAKVYRVDHNVHLPMEEGVSIAGFYSSRFYGARRMEGRVGDMLAALRIEIRVKTEIDPETGQPWTDDRLGHQWHHRDRSLWIHDHFEWVPFVVSPRHVRKPWAVYQAEQEQARARQAEQAESYRRQRVVAEYGRLQRQIEGTRSNIDNAVVTIEQVTQTLAEVRQAAVEAVTKRNRPLAAQEVVGALLDPQDGEASLASQYVHTEGRLKAFQSQLERYRDVLADTEARFAAAEVPNPEWPEVTSQP